MLNPVPVKMQAVPKGFEKYKQFINWRLVPDKKKPGKFKKLPCNSNGTIISAHDPTQWMTAEQACLSEYGIAFVFTAHDPFWFIDLDEAWNGSCWSEIADWCFRCFPGAALEISNSGTGLHLFGAGSHSLPADHGCKNMSAGIELYTQGRFVALTGTSAAGNAFLDYSDRLATFVVQARLQPRDTTLEDLGDGDAVDPRYTGPADDDELIALMLDSVGSVKTQFGSKAHVRDLWEMNVPVLEGCMSAPSRQDGVKFDWSSADASLMWHLSFWTGRDRDRMVRLFERSKLYRPDKYEGKGAYRLPLVLKQGFRNTAVYDRPKPGTAMQPIEPGAVAPSQRGGRSTMDLAEQIQHFDGCWYIQASHSVMLPDGRIVPPKVFDVVKGGHKFQMQYDNGKPTTEAFTCFTQSRMHTFNSAIDTCFRPDREPGALVDGRINTWRAPVVVETPGDITRFLEHVARMIPNPVDRSILFAYMQSLARNPGKKFQWAPVIQGVPGNGKSLLIRVLYYAMSKELSHLPKASQLTEKYNSWMAERIFIGVEEIKVTDRREVLEDLKDAVTNDWIEIRGMHREKKMADNFTNWLFCTNHKDAIPVDRSERRYAIFYTAQQTVEDLVRDGMTDDYFVSLYDWLKAGGYAAVAHWLRHGAIEAVKYDPATVCQRAPHTSSTAEAIGVSLGRVEQEIMEAVDNCEPGFKDGWISTGAVARWLQQRGARDVSARKMGEILKSLGYTHAFKSSVKVMEENGVRAHIYRKNDSFQHGDQNDFLIAQGYSSTLRSGFTVQPGADPLAS